MPAENEFEKNMQQLLNQWQVPPSPADWPAIEQRLHPGKKRFALWWLLPLLLAPILAALWMRNEPVAHTQDAETPTITTTTENNSPQPPQPLAKGSAQALNNQAKTPTAIAGKATSIENGLSNAEPNTAKNLAPSSASVAEVKPSLAATYPPAQPPVGSATTHTQYAATVAVAEVAAISQKVADSLPNQNNPQEPTMPSLPLLGTAIAPAQIKPMFSGAKGPAINAPEAAPKTNSIASPILPKPAAKWQWLLYASAGGTSPREQLTGLKAAADMSTSNPNNTVQNTSTQLQAGSYFSAGVAVARRWTRNWQWQAGLGINSSRWHEKSHTYRDSFNAASGLVLRTDIGRTNNLYQLTMLEVPLQLAGRIAGRKAGSIWWTTGINNQWVLKMNNQQEQQTQATNFNSIFATQTLNNLVQKWQPQFQLGLMYEHAGKKINWQLAPLLNYSLPPVFKTGNKYHLLQYHLQLRAVLPQKKQ